MPDILAIQAIEEELAADQQRLDEIDALESKLLANIPHGEFRVATQEANLRSERQMITERMRYARKRLADAKK